LATRLLKSSRNTKLKKKDYDLEQLLDAVRGTALARLKETDAALDEFEQMLKGSGNRSLDDDRGNRFHPILEAVRTTSSQPDSETLSRVS
jgi:hypothetical protein